MSRGAPSANRTKPLPIPEGPHFTVSLLKPERFLSNRSAWILSQGYPLFEASMQYSPLLTTGALKAPHFSPVLPLSQGWESLNYTLTTYTDGSDSQRK